jgi:hypothetical protein
MKFAPMESITIATGRRIVLTRIVDMILRVCVPKEASNAVQTTNVVPIGATGENVNSANLLECFYMSETTGGAK